MIEILPPAIILLVGAGWSAFTRGYLRDAIVLLAPLITIWLCGKFQKALHCP